MADLLRTTITAHTFTATRRARRKKIFHEGNVPTGSEVTDNEVDECINGEREREKRDSKLLTETVSGKNGNWPLLFLEAKLRCHLSPNDAIKSKDFSNTSIDSASLNSHRKRRPSPSVTADGQLACSFRPPLPCSPTFFDSSPERDH